MLFLSRVRIGVLTTSIVLSVAVLTLGSILIYSRITSPLVFGQIGPGDGDDDADDTYLSLKIVLLKYSTLARKPDTDISNQHHLQGPLIIPPGTDTDTLLAVSIAIINIVTVPIMLIVDYFKRKTILSSVAVEASWLFILWVLWLTGAAYSAWCSSTQYVNFVRCQVSPVQCLQYEFLEIFSFVNWIVLMLYSNTLFTLAVINHMRKQPIWFVAVHDTPRLPPLVFAAPVPMDEAKLLLSGSSYSFSQHEPQRHPDVVTPSLGIHTTQAYRRGEDSSNRSGPSQLLSSGGRGALDSTSRTRSVVTLPPSYSERPGAHPLS